jgi:CRISPR-associated protein Cas4
MNTPILSITDITSYMYCPRKFYLKKVRGIKEKQNQLMVKGRLKHEVFDRFNKNEKNIVTEIKEKISKEEIYKIYRTDALKITNQIINFHKELLSGFKISRFDFLHEVLSSLEKEIKLRISSIEQGIEKGYLGKELWENLPVKYFSEVEMISEELGLKGRIDRVELGEEIIPYEIKTRKEVYEADKIQLAGYSLLLEDKFKKKIYFGIIETAEKKEKIIIDEELRKRFLGLAEEIRTMLREKKEMPINSSFKKCQYCNFQEICFSG